MPTAILIDDEKNSRESLRKKIETHCPGVSILGECNNGLEGLDAIQKLNPDIVFLDIEMPHMNGFTMLQQLPERNFELIFTTAFNQYAINAIRFSALDYLVKPVDVTELVQSVSKVSEKPANTINKQQLDILQQFFNNQKSVPDRIAVAVTSGLEIIHLNNILYLEAEGNYTNIHLENSRPLLSSKTLKEFEDILPATQFCRIHNASLINIQFIKKYNKGEGGQVVLSNGAVLDVARRRKEELLQLLQTVATKI
jgi:two-component system, LytTR family, response regulator